MTVQDWLGVDNKLGIDIWEKKYRKDGESFDEWLDRVSAGDAEVKKAIVEKKFLFGGRILSNRGMNDHGKKVTYSNCYVIAPPEDNIESIFDCAKKLARTYSYGGGCGVDISKLAPRGARVNNTADATSGSVSFMDLYSLVTGLIGQNGRRGALMLSLSCEHPDLEEFIEIKSDLNRVTKANISIRITDEFMNAVRDGTEFTLRFYRPETGEDITKVVDARKVFEKICKMNNDYAEPGMLFWDRIEDWNILSEYPDFEYAGVNPCAEEPLCSGGSCLLGSLNLAEFVTTDSCGKSRFDYDEFSKATEIGVRALNEVLLDGIALHPLEIQRETAFDWRQIGLGVFGLADALIKLGIRYGSEESLRLCDEIGRAMINTAVRASANLTDTYGCFPKFNLENTLKSRFLVENVSQSTLDLVKEKGLCNSQLLTIAPTGTLSSMLGVSGGVEPIFANYYTRKTESLHGRDEYYKVYTPIVEKYMKQNNLRDDSELPEYFITAQNLNYKDRILMQSVWQKHIDASISSTVNVPNSFSESDVCNLYEYAWKMGLKGVTMFRDGCARVGILTTGDKTDEHSNDGELKRGDVVKADNDCVGLKRTLYTGCGTLHCEAFFDPATGELRETYFSKGSSGGCNNFMIGLSRMISLASRGGVGIDYIVDQLKSSGTCPSYAVRAATKKDTSKGSSCPVAIGNALVSMHDEFLEKYVTKVADKDCKKSETKVIENSTVSGKCPVCGEALVFEGGCNTCKSCGWSKCE